MIPDVPPQAGQTDATLPFVTYEIISCDAVHLLSDLSGLYDTRIQYVSYADSRRSANAIVRAIKNSGVVALQGVTGGVDIRGVQVESGIRHYTETPTDGNQTSRYLAEIDFSVQHLGD